MSLDKEQKEQLMKCFRVIETFLIDTANRQQNLGWNAEKGAHELKRELIALGKKL